MARRRSSRGSSRSASRAGKAQGDRSSAEAVAAARPVSVPELLVSDFHRRLVSDRPSRRDLTTLNVEHAPKEEFSRVGSIYSARLGRTLTQWEVFAIMVAEAAERYAVELAVLRGRPGAS